MEHASCTPQSGADRVMQNPVALVVPPAHGKQRRRPIQFDVRVELCGCQDDPLYQRCFQMLREYRSRYAPMLRMYFTGVSTPRGDAASPLPNVLQGHFTRDDVAAAITVDGHVARRSLACSDGDVAAGTASTTAIGRTTAASLSDAQEHGPAWVERFMEHAFLGAKLLRSALQAQGLPHQRTFAFCAAASPSQQCHGSSAAQPSPPPPVPPSLSSSLISGGDDWPLYFRHYVHEGSRTASFLVANKSTGHAVVIDPSPNVKQYQRDLEAHGLRLEAIGLTHFYLDVATGHRQLHELYPRAFVAWCGSMAAASSSLLASGSSSDVGCSSSAPSARREIGSVLWSMSLGGAFRLVARWTPAMTNESVVFELLLDDTLLAVVSGPTVPVDGWARHDVRRILPLAQEDLFGVGASADVLTAAPAASPTQTTQQSPSSPSTTSLLRATMQWVSQRYFGGGPVSGGGPDSVHQQKPSSAFATPPLSAHAPNPLDAAMVFPSHGGYNHMTHQLDLHWCAHIADLKRFAHVKKIYQHVWDVPRDTEKKGNKKAVDPFDAYVNALPVLPVGGLFHSNRAQNMADAGVLSTAFRTKTTAAIGNHIDDDAVVIVDVRPYAAYVANHLPGSINVPMTYPGGAFRAKKAELWLQCCLKPNRSVRVVCPSLSEVDETRQRFEHIGIPSGNLSVVCSDAVDWTSGIRGAPTAEGGPSPSAVHPVPMPVEDDTKATSSVVVVGWKRLSSAKSLEALSIASGRTGEATTTTLVVDVRTPYEFKNGSHRASVHCPLADLCAMFADDTAVPKDRLASHILEHLHDNALVNGVPICRRVESIDRVIVYCAAGYRSHIAVSLVRAAFEWQQTKHMAEEDDAAKAKRLFPDVMDVAGGALHIMMHRPDLWIVKDRSIVCIS